MLMFNIYRMLFFSFEEGQNGRNHSSHPRPTTKFSLAKFPILPHWGRMLCSYPLMLFGRHIIIVCNFPQFWIVNPAIEALNYRPRLAFSGLTTFQSNLKDSASSLSACLAVKGQYLLGCSYPTLLQCSCLATYKSRMSKRSD